MPIKDLSGKTAYELEREDFEQLFCWRCAGYEHCSRDDKKVLGCKVFVDSGLWDKPYENKDKTGGGHGSRPYSLVSGENNRTSSCAGHRGLPATPVK